MKRFAPLLIILAGLVGYVTRRERSGQVTEWLEDSEPLVLFMLVDVWDRMVRMRRLES